jgi:hypothetical protein
MIPLAVYITGASTDTTSLGLYDSIPGFGEVSFSSLLQENTDTLINNKINIFFMVLSGLSVKASFKGELANYL